MHSRGPSTQTRTKQFTCLIGIHDTHIPALKLGSKEKATGFKRWNRSQSRFSGGGSGNLIGVGFT